MQVSDRCQVGFSPTGISGALAVGKHLCDSRGLLWAHTCSGRGDRIQASWCRSTASGTSLECAIGGGGQLAPCTVQLQRPRHASIVDLGLWEMGILCRGT